MKDSWLFKGLLVAALLIISMAPMPSPLLAEVTAKAPKGLTAMSLNAKEMVGLMQNSHFSEAKKLLRTMNGEHRHLSKQQGKKFNERKQRELAVMHMWLHEIDLAIRNHSAIGGAIAANQLTAALIRYRNFTDSLAVATAWLAYLSREIELLNIENAADNASLLELRLIDAGATWQRLRSELLKNLRNKTLVINVDTLLNHLNSDRSEVSQVADARKLQQLVAQVGGLLPVK